MRSFIILSCGVVCAGAAAAAVPPDGMPSGARNSGMSLAQSESPLTLPDAQVAPEVSPLDPAAPTDPEAGSEDLTQPDPSEPSTGEDDGISPDDLSLGEIPVIETMELTPDIARRALDVYLLVKTKYENAELDRYENLQDFVDQNIEGKNFESDIKAAGFNTVNDWNLAITTVGFAYTSAIDDQSAEIMQQITEIEADTELAQDMKDRMIASLKAMIPSENNKKVIEELLADAAYAGKLKQLDIEEE
jgi:hypothetical protein